MSFLLLISGALGAGFALWRIGRRTRFFLHTFQLMGYKSGALHGWLIDHFRDALVRRSHIVGALLLVAGWITNLPSWALFLLWAVVFASSKRYRRDKPKKALVWTPRMKRLAALTGVFLFALILTPVWIWPLPNSPAIVVLSGLWLADLLAPFAILLASIFAFPVEKQIHEGFKKEARLHLAGRSDLTVVAITGSYGKTSVKFAVREVLSQRFPTLATPGSFNTPMGICRVVNTELTDEHRFMILEMGMRHPGDIAELCDIARPNIAVVTSVGPAHLESMGSLEAIAKEKASILSFLDADGVAILNVDDERVAAMKNGLSCTVLTVSANNDPADIRSSDVTYGSEGARFLVHADGDQHWFSTRLLGRHNVLNVLLAVAVGRVAGLSLRQMSQAIRRLEPVDHRLKLSQKDGLLILDDAFNSNPVGAANAVEVLSMFTSGQRVIVTPGMIELGDREAELNQAFGAQIAKAADHAILVGPLRTQPIAEGLKQAGFPQENIHVVSSLFEAQDWLKANTKSGDVVLYENDLPDQFNES